MQSKRTTEESTDRGVSPVIGVILMVAITVILAAVIAAFVLDIGPGDIDPNAGVTVDEYSGSDDIEVTLNSLDSGTTGVAVVDDPDDLNEEGDVLTTSGQSDTYDLSDGDVLIAFSGDDLDNVESVAIIDNLDEHHG